MQIERRFEVNGIKPLFLDELDDFHYLGGFWLDALDIFVVDDHVAVFFLLEAFDKFAARCGFVFGDAEEDLLDAGVVVFVELVEADGFRPSRGHHFDGERNQAECDVTFPDGGCHGVFILAGMRVGLL